MDTAWERFQTARGGPGSEFPGRMRALESAVASLNLAPECVHLASELAALEPDLEVNERLTLIALILVSLAALQEGSTRFPVVGPLSIMPMRRMLDALGIDASSNPDHSERMAASIETLLLSGRASSMIGYNQDDYKPLLFLAPYIYHHRIHRAEVALASRLSAMLTTSAPKAIGAQLGDALEAVLNQPLIVQGQTIIMSKEQRDAVCAAGRAGLTVISGGPGTGKTSIVVAIMRLLARLGIEPEQIALAAPTGKAAYRIGECVREALSRIAPRDRVDQALLDATPEPTTVHRLLGYSPDSGRFRHHRNNPLPAKAVIVDEGSMLDLTLMERLTNAIQIGARLIVLGDADQLPSVAAGSVFRDLVVRSRETTGPLADASVRLEENHRMRDEDAAGRAVLTIANAINNGNDDFLNPAIPADGQVMAHRASALDLKFAGVEFLSSSSRDLGTFLDRWYAEQVRGADEIANLVRHSYVTHRGAFNAGDCTRLRRLFEHIGKSRILCATRVFETGSERINARLHSRAAEQVGVAAERSPYIVGEPLMVLRNDYERGLFNGDQGIRLWVCRDDGPQLPMAVFAAGDNFVAFRFEALHEFVELSYAMTVHKAQGSEFDSVAIVLPENPLPILTRELIYTAVSRSRHSVVFLGDSMRLREAVANRVERFSGLSQRL